MMFTGPARNIVPQRISVNASLIDVLPTLVDLIGGEPEDEWSGRSLLPILQNAKGASALVAQLRERTLYAHLAERGNARHQWAAFDQDWYLIETHSGEILLFSSSDVHQTNDVYPAEPERVNGIVARLEKLKSERSAGETNAVEIALDENLVKTLRSLGYIER